MLADLLVRELEATFFTPYRLSVYTYGALNPLIYDDPDGRQERLKQFIERARALKQQIDRKIIYGSYPGSHLLQTAEGDRQLQAAQEGALLVAEVASAVATAGEAAVIIRSVRAAQAAARAEAAAAAATKATQTLGANRLSALSRGALAKLLTTQHRRLLGDFFGRGRRGAQEALKVLRQGGTLPRGLTRETLLVYKEIAKKTIAEGIDKAGTQAARLKVIEEALKKLP